MCHMFRVIIGHFVVCRFLFVICVPELCLSLFFGDVLVNCYSWLAVVCDVVCCSYTVVEISCALMSVVALVASKTSCSLSSLSVMNY